MGARVDVSPLVEKEKVGASPVSSSKYVPWGEPFASGMTARAVFSSAGLPETSLPAMDPVSLLVKAPDVCKLDTNACPPVALVKSFKKSSLLV